MFGFRNPGRMRVPVEQALAGGISDCRNHGIQNLFRYVGLGDHAGSGIPSILKSWQSQHWRTPLLYEDPANDLTLLELRTLSLLPDESVQNLHTRFGDSFLSLSELQRIALITAETEGYVSHSRMRSLSTAHSSDLSAILTGLVKDGFLEKEGETRASIYSIKGTRPKKPFMQDLYPNSPDKAPNSPDKAPNSPDKASSSPDKAPSSPDKALSSPDKAPSSPHLDALLSSVLADWGMDQMPERLTADKMRKLVVSLCKDHWIPLADLSMVLKRQSKFLQAQYLSSMVAEGILMLKYPETRNHPAQAYKAKA